MPSFVSARRRHSRATASETPPTSNRILPGTMTATQNSGLPLPPPIRTSIGLRVMGLSGKMRIQSLPLRVISRLITTRHASICVAVTNPRSSAFRPYSPNASSAPEVAKPARLPFDCLRYLTRLGIRGIVLPPLTAGANRLEIILLADPHLDADQAGGGVGLAETVVDVRAKGVQRDLALLAPLDAGNLGAVDTAAATDLDAVHAHVHGDLLGALHGALER